MRIRRSRLVLAWLATAGLLVAFVGQQQFAVPQPPPSNLPVDPPNGGIVSADDDTLSGSTPYRDIAVAPAAPPATSPTAAPVAANKPSPPAPVAAAPPSKAKLLQSAQLTETAVVVNGQQYPLRDYDLMSMPDDPSASQWWVTNAKLDQAWDTPAGSEETILAVIDTGFALGHEEFAGRWYANPGETPANGLDDDGNGFVDDVSGWDFAHNDNVPQAGDVNPAGSGTNHGTRVAGIAAATGNNGKGIAGADWHTKIMPLQALDDDSNGTTWEVGQAILYAAMQGADVISISLGSNLPDAYVREAVAVATGSGSIVVASSGNDGCDCMVYPANYPEVVSVGALTSTNLPASFSSYGSNLDILAPGTAMRTASWTSASPTASYISNVQGTSFAAPLVSGLLTRLISQRPEATPLQLVAALTESTNRLTLPATTPRSPSLGYGTVDAAKATARVSTPNAVVQAHSFVPVSVGARLFPGSPLEIIADYDVRRCEDGTPGTTPLYRLALGSDQFYTISQTEVWIAQLYFGWQAALFAEVCLEQPHDNAESVRALDLAKEFQDNYEHIGN